MIDKEYRAPKLLPNDYDKLIQRIYIFLDRSFNPRDKKAPKWLVSDIRNKNGYIHPIIVFKYSDTRYGAGGGWQRVDAGDQIGYTVLPCKIFNNRKKMIEYLNSTYLETSLSNLAKINNIMINYKEFGGDIGIIAQKVSKPISTVRRAVEISKHPSLLSLVAEHDERDTEDWRFIYDIGGRDVFAKKGLRIDIAELLALEMSDYSEVDIGKIATLLYKNRKSYDNKIGRIIDYIVSKPERDDYRTLITESLNVKKKKNITIILHLTPDEYKSMDNYKREMRVKSDGEFIMRILRSRFILYEKGFIGKPAKPFKEVRVKIGTQKVLVRMIDDRCKVAILGDDGFYIDYWVDTQMREWNNNTLIRKPVKNILNSLEIKY